MTTSEFISGCISGKRTKDGKIYGGRVQWIDGILYSYGRHYPLAWKMGDCWMVNDAGYSATTSKHISATRSAVFSATKQDAITVQLPRAGYFGYTKKTLQDIPALRELIKKDVAHHLQIVKDTKRKNTQVYAWRRRNLRNARANMRRFEKMALHFVPVSTEQLAY